MNKRRANLPQEASNYFFKLSNILGIIPPCSAAFGPNQRGIRKLYRMYAAFLILITVLITLITIVYRWRVIYPNHSTPTTFQLTDTFLDLTGAIANVATIAVPTFGCFSNFQSLLQHFQKTHSLKQLMEMAEKRTFIFLLAVSHAILFFLYAYEGHIWIVHSGWQTYTIYLFRYIQFYHIFLTFLIITVFVSFLKSQFQYINDTLRLCTRGITIHDRKIFKVKGKIDYDVISCSVQKLTRLYVKQITQMNRFNKIFGLPLSLLVLNFSGNLIYAINSTIVMYQLDYTSDSLKVSMILNKAIWTVFQLVLGSLVVSFCGSTEQESQETANVCLNVLTYLPLCTKEENTNNLRNELNLLIQLSSLKCPGFSAAGFFSMNNALLLGIVSSVTSYVIVLIQFNK